MSLLNETYQASKRSQRPPVLSGLDRLTQQFLGWRKRNSYAIDTLLTQAELIDKESSAHRQRPLNELQQRLKHQQRTFKRGAGSEQLNHTLSLLSEAASRLLKLRPYPVQMLAVLLLQQGTLAEMATGEGKSLAICLAAILAGWTGKPCHVITANDYLAKRDAEQFNKLYRFCGLSVGAVTSKMSSGERKQQYRRSIVYTTSKELLADYLRDQITLGACQSLHQQLLAAYLQSSSSDTQQVMRGIDTAIIDEADSVLIDEATTPLIISQQQPNPALNEVCERAYQVACQLELLRDYQLDKEQRRITLTKAGKRQVTNLSAGFPAFFRDSSRSEEMVLLALTAKEFFRQGQQYVVENGKVVIVDQFTGRKMEQRTWQRGLQQMIELKEGVTLSNPSESLAQLSFQGFFSLFQTLCGTTGTAWEARKEFWEVYSLPVVKVPLNKPEQRREQAPRSFQTQQQKNSAIVAETLGCYRRGQPVLIGSRNITASEQLGRQLEQAGIPHQILNAVNHQQEADIIASAGQAKQVTVATNMAGRGADIELGDGVAAVGGLHVIVSETHESKRIDRQLIGRSARQGQPGSYRIYHSSEDEVLNRQKSLGKLAKMVCKKKSTTGRLVERLAATAQNLLQRSAAKHRRELARRDEWLAEMLP